MPTSAKPNSAGRKPAATKPVQAGTRSSGASAAPPSTPWLEWTAGGVGLLLIMLTLGLIGFEAVRGDSAPPAIIARVTAVSPGPGGYLVQIEVRNEGGAPASQVVVEGEQKTAAEPQVSEATFDYLPAHSSRKGGLFFSENPQGNPVVLRAKGYIEP